MTFHAVAPPIGSYSNDETKLPPPAFTLTRLLIQRGLAFIYFIGFLIAANQFVPLAGQNGILPISLFLNSAKFWQAPSLFFIYASDSFLQGTAWFGVLLSLAAMAGLTERFGMAVSAVSWTLLWFVYMSFVNAGQTFYSFGWEMLLLEAGFLAIFLGDRKSAPPGIVIWLYRWLLFRLMFGAGLIKIRGDECWRDLTCMDYHYETQPLPNPLSWNLHHFPHLWHKIEVGGTHFIELILPFAYFIPRLAAWAGGITILFHMMLIFSGNLSWLNYITMVIAFACFGGTLSRRVSEGRVSMGWIRQGILALLTALIGFLSITPTMNLLSPRQKMNASFDPLHLVNTYGAFGSITRVRREVVLEGTDDAVPGPQTVWKEYEFKCKPGDVKRAPCIVSPYHYKLDWQMWFAAMNPYHYHPWILNLAGQLLENDPGVNRLISKNPFPEHPPRFVRAVWYQYRFTKPSERGKTGAWWVRVSLGEYLPPLSLNNPQFQSILQKFRAHIKK